MTDPTVDSQVLQLQGSGADTFFNIATPKFAAQAIRKAWDIGWKPLHFLNNVSRSVGAVLTPAGLDKAVGVIIVDLRARIRPIRSGRTTPASRNGRRS